MLRVNSGVSLATQQYKWTALVTLTADYDTHLQDILKNDELTKLTSLKA
jgi:hypothetical protein